MTPVILLEELARYLKLANKDYRLTDEAVKNNPLTVVPGFLKRRENADEQFFPHIVPRLIRGTDTDDGSTATVRIYFGTYCEDVADGWRELFNLMEHSRQALLKQRTIADKFRLLLPIKYEMPEEQPYPEWVGYMDVIYTIYQPQEEIIYDENCYGVIWEKKKGELMNRKERSF